MPKAPQHGVDMDALSRQGLPLQDIRTKAAPMDHRFTGTRHLWPGVTNPIARSVVETAHAMLPGDTLYGPAIDDPDKCPMEIHDYQQWLNEVLGASGLGKALAGGPALLPDATDHLPWPWRYLAQKYGPRTMPQLTRFIIRNLEWYLDQSRKLRDPWTITAEQLPMTAMLTTLMMVALASSTPLYQVHWVVLLGLTVLATGFVFSAQLIWGRDSHKHKTHCAEFYHYLVREYSDADEDETLDADEYRLKLSRRYQL